jgi:hypothetical protein
MVSNEVREAILESEVGPKILHHLAKNPDVVTELKAKSVPGRFSSSDDWTRNSRKRSPRQGRRKPTRRNPLPPLRKSPERRHRSLPSAAPVPPSDRVRDSSGVFHGSYADWKAQRKAGKIK